jgi:DNA-binding transcriptional MerR regulator
LPKAAEAFRNIGEVSSELGVKKHVLRFWELKFPQLKPMKRGGGRRLYRPADVQLLRGIRNLLQSAGYTIKGVQKILREQGAEPVKLAGGTGTTRPAPGASGRLAPSAVQDRPAPFGGEQLHALRMVVTELDACEALLAGAASTHEKIGVERHRRVGSRG